MKQKKKIGVFLTLFAGVLSIVSCIVYTQVMYTLPVVYIAMIALVLVAAASFFANLDILTKIAPVLAAFLAATAIIWGVNPMVNQIGYVIAGLDEIGTILPLLISMGIMVLVMLMTIVSSFMKQKEEA